jgi:hypothetical protein
MEGLDELEEYLKRADILYIGGFPASGGAHPGKLVVLEGGVGVLAKPADANAAAPEMVPREVAAWIVARHLGWADLVATTVLRRDIPGDAGGLVDASFSVAWPNNAADVDPGFDDEDRWRAAVFDFVVQQGDRGGHNWLAVPAPGAGTSMLKLIDHGHCFGYPPPGSVNSTFFTEKRGQELPAEIVTALHAILDDWPSDHLQDLLPDEAVSNTEDRVRALLEQGSL